MSTQYDIALLGNLIIDEVIRVEDWPKEGTSNNYLYSYTNIGGIGNIIKTLPTSKLKIFVEGSVNEANADTIKTFLYQNNINIFNLNFSTKPTSKAYIISSSSERTSFVNWGCGIEAFEPSEKRTRWTHISYLDIIPDLVLQKIRENSDYMSADLCLSNPSTMVVDKIGNQLQYIDYMIASASELKHYDYAHTKTTIIRHSKNDTVISSENNKQETINNPHSFLINVDVLGAGDVYCANFIASMLEGAGVQDAVQIAHIEASKYIKNNI